MIGPKQVYNNERGNLMNKIFSTIVALVVEVIPSSSFDIFFWNYTKAAFIKAW